MNLTGLLNDALSGETVNQISQQIGADEHTTQQAIQSALPVLLGTMANNTQDPMGAASLAGALERDHDGSALGNLGGLIGSLGGQHGGGILGHIFGGNRPVAEERISQSSGLDMSKVGPLLMILAPIVMGALGQMRQQGNVNQNNLPEVLGGATRQTASNSPLMGVLGSILDRDRDGSSMDDIAGMIGGMLGGRR
jgi:hypothetical protein